MSSEFLGSFRSIGHWRARRAAWLLTGLVVALSGCGGDTDSDSAEADGEKEVYKCGEPMPVANLEAHKQMLRCKGLTDECAVAIIGRANYLAQKAILTADERGLTLTEANDYSRSVYSRMDAALHDPELYAETCVADEDGDLVADSKDGCPGTAELAFVGLDGCPPR